MKKIIIKTMVSVGFVALIYVSSYAQDEADCNVEESCKIGNSYITLDKKKYDYSVKMGVKHAETRDMTVKCIVNSSGDYVAPYSVEIHCTSSSLWCSQKHNTGNRLVITCYNSKTSGDTLHLKIDKVDCKKFIEGDNGSNTTKVRAVGCTWGSFIWS